MLSEKFIIVLETFLRGQSHADGAARVLVLLARRHEFGVGQSTQS
jgi:hypothetical protein